jgi:hypothetical protein
VRRPASAAILLSLLAAGAAAQVAPADVGPLTPPLALTGRVESSREHGCSRSHESVGADADLALEIDAAGQASLRLVGQVYRVSGPSFGAYRAGDHDFSTLTDRFETRWSGVARLDASGTSLSLDLTAREGATIRWTGPGSLPLPPAVTSTVSITTACTKVSRDVFPPTWSEHEVASPVTVLACAFAGAMPDPLDRFLDEGAEVAFAAGLGVRTVADDHMWGASTTILRHAE